MEHPDRGEPWIEHVKNPLSELSIATRVLHPTFDFALQDKLRSLVFLIGLLCVAGPFFEEKHPPSWRRAGGQESDSGAEGVYTEQQLKNCIDASPA